MDTTKTIVSAAEVIRNFGYWQQQALAKPLTITHHGRARTMLISTDYFGREEMETAGGDSEQALGKLDAILNNMAQGYVHFDAQLQVVDLNRVAEGYYGISRRELIGKTLSEALNLPANEMVQQILQRALRTGEAQMLEANSSLFPGRRIRMRAFPYLDGVAMLFTNVTEEERLRTVGEEWEACREALAEARNQTWCRLDGRGRVTEAGESLRFITGFTPEALSSFRLFDIIGTADRRRLQTAFEALMQTGQPIVTTARFLAKDGTEPSLNLIMTPVRRDYATVGAIMLLSASDDSVPSKAGLSSAA